jgi:ketosteroid isomerase-like protein
MLSNCAIFSQAMLETAEMRRGSTLMMAAVCCLLTAVCASAQTAKEGSSAEAAKLVALERSWNQAQLSRDATAIAGLIGDKFINTEYDGAVSDRGKFLADFADPQFQPSIMSIADLKVDSYSSTAVVTGNYHTKGTYGGKPYEHFGRFTDTWVSQDGKWLCVASHTSLVKK